MVNSLASTESEKLGYEQVLWEKCLETLEHVIPRPTYELCLRGSHATGSVEQCLRIRLAHHFALDMVTRRKPVVTESARKVLRELAGSHWDLEWVAESEDDATNNTHEPETTRTASAPITSVPLQDAPEGTPKRPPRNATIPVSASTSTVAALAPRSTSTRSNKHGADSNPSADQCRPVNGPASCAESADDRFTFERFVEGPSNHMAIRAACEIVERPGGRFNPLLIYGEAGLGKSHLLRAVQNRLRARNPRLRQVLTSSESFTNELVDAFQNHSMTQFRKKYRHVDVLLIDDMEFLINKERIQEEFYHTFEDHVMSGRQVVLTCDRPPHLLKALQERLHSRISSGLAVDIVPPTLEMRKQILRQQVREAGSSLSEEALAYISEQFHGSVRRLEGALVRVLAVADTLGTRSPDIGLVRHALSSILPTREARTRVITLETILQTVCGFYRVERDDLLGSRRDRNVTTPRHIAMYLAQELTSMRCREISEAFGNRDYSTVVHAIKKIAAQVEHPRIKSDLSQIQDMLSES